MRRILLLFICLMPVLAFSQTKKENKETLKLLNRAIAKNAYDHNSYMQRSIVKGKMGDKKGARADRQIAIRLGLRETYDNIEVEPE